MRLHAVMILSAAGMIATGRPGRAQEHAAPGAGVVDMPVTCTAAARTGINEGVALLHHMTYPQARATFERIVALDANCAMAHWGIAMTLFQPLWPTRPTPAALQRGWNEVGKAKTIATVTGYERSFIDAAEAFFLEPEGTDYWLRIRRWEAAMQRVYRAYPQDVEAAAFYGLAHLATTRSDTVTRATADEAAEVLLAAYASHPDHPGLMHYLVHANDVPTRERESLEITRKYDASAPDNPHALHMPTHIYTRLGEWDGVVNGNRRAAAAALAFPAGDRGQFVWDEFPHATEYIVYAFLQLARDDSAATALQRLLDMPRLEPTFKTAFHLMSTQARYALERRDWTRAAAIVPRQPAALPWDAFRWPEGVAHFARGLGAAHLGRREDARSARERLAQLEEASDASGEDLFTRNIRMLRLELDAWIAHMESRPAEAMRLMNEAVTLEATTPKHAVTPGPTLPALELLGDLLLEQHDAAAALEAYRRSLAAYPRRYNSLLGAARAAREAGESGQARSYYRELLRAAPEGTRLADLAEARQFLGVRSGRP